MEGGGVYGRGVWEMKGKRDEGEERERERAAMTKQTVF
jgi:hypothetical protein